MDLYYVCSKENNQEHLCYLRPHRQCNLHLIPHSLYKQKNTHNNIRHFNHHRNHHRIDNRNNSNNNSNNNSSNNSNNNSNVKNTRWGAVPLPAVTVTTGIRMRRRAGLRRAARRRRSG